MTTIDFPAARQRRHASQEAGEYSAYCELITRWKMSGSENAIFLVPSQNIGDEIQAFIRDANIIVIDTVFIIQPEQTMTYIEKDESDDFANIDEYNQYMRNRLNKAVMIMNSKLPMHYNQIKISVYDANFALEVSKVVLSSYKSSILWDIKPVDIKINGVVTHIDAVHKIE